MRRATLACRRLMRARVQKRCRRGFPVSCCGMSSAGGCPRASLAAASKTEPAQSPSFGAYVLPAVQERFGKRKSGGDELLVPEWYQRGVSRGIAPGSNVCGKFQPLRALCEEAPFEGKWSLVDLR